MCVCVLDASGGAVRGGSEVHDGTDVSRANGQDLPVADDATSAHPEAGLFFFDRLCRRLFATWPTSAGRGFGAVLSPFLRGTGDTYLLLFEVYGLHVCLLGVGHAGLRLELDVAGGGRHGCRVYLCRCDGCDCGFGEGCCRRR